MRPEEFDKIVQRKILDLTSLPELAYREEETWEKVSAKMGKRGTGWLFSTLVGVLVLSGIYAWKQGEWKQTDLPVMATQVVPPREETPLKSFATQTRVKEPKKTISFLPGKEKEGKKRVHISPKLDSTEKNRPLTKRFVNQSIVADSDSLPYPESVNGREETAIFREGYLGLGGHHVLLGHRWVKPLSSRIALAGTVALWQPMYAPAIPNLVFEAEGRYYLLSKEKKFTAFVYGQVNLLLSTASTPASHLQVGGEARYRLSKKGAANAAFLFLRLPVYQTPLFPRTPSFP